MEENFNHEEIKHCFLCKHPAVKFVLIGLLVFLGAFLAFYVVADWHFKRMLDPMIQMQNMNRAMMRQERQMDKFVQKEFQKGQRMVQNTAPFISC